MSKRTTSLCVVMLFLFALSLYAQQQTPAKPPTETSVADQEKAAKDAEEQKKNEARALAMMEQILGDANGLRLPENRAFVFSTAANIFWPSDQKRARLLFRDAINAVVDLQNEEAARAGRGRESESNQIRRQVLQTLSRRDPQLALELLKLSRPPATNRSDGERLSEEEAQLEQSIASQVAMADPKKALQLAIEGLAKGVSMEALSMLNRLQSRDAEAATQLAAEMIRRLQSEDFAKNRQAMTVAVSLLQLALRSSTQSGVTILNTGGTASAATRLAIDQNLVRDLVTVIGNNVSVAAGAGVNVQFSPFLAEIERISPESAARIRSVVDRTATAIGPEARTWMQFSTMMQTSSVDALLEYIGKAPSTMRSNMYVQAASRALLTGDVEKARQIANQYVPAGSERDSILAMIESRSIQSALEKGKLDEARAAASNIASKVERASQLVRIATRAITEGNTKLAADVLDEALLLVSGPAERSDQTNVLLQIARAFTPLEPDRSFQILEQLIDQANEILGAWAVLDKYGMGQGMFRSGELIVQRGRVPAFGSASSIGRDLGPIAKIDFDRARAMAERIHRTEVRIAALLNLAQGILAPGQATERFIGNSPIVIR